MECSFEPDVIRTLEPGFAPHAKALLHIELCLLRRDKSTPLGLRLCRKITIYSLFIGVIHGQPRIGVLHSISGISVCYHRHEICNSTLYESLSIWECGNCELSGKRRRGLVPLSYSSLYTLGDHHIRELQVVQKPVCLRAGVHYSHTNLGYSNRPVAALLCSGSPLTNLEITSVISTQFILRIIT